MSLISALRVLQVLCVATGAAKGGRLFDAPAWRWEPPVLQGAHCSCRYAHFLCHGMRVVCHMSDEAPPHSSDMLPCLCRWHELAAPEVIPPRDLALQPVAGKCSAWCMCMCMDCKGGRQAFSCVPSSLSLVACMAQVDNVANTFIAVRSAQRPPGEVASDVSGELAS